MFGHFVFEGCIGSDDFFKGLGEGSRCHFTDILPIYDYYCFLRACFRYRVFFRNDIEDEGSFSHRSLEQYFCWLA
jgi:hypothetical protein